MDFPTLDKAAAWKRAYDVAVEELAGLALKASEVKQRKDQATLELLRLGIAVPGATPADAATRAASGETP